MKNNVISRNRNEFKMKFRIYDNSGPIVLGWGRAENSPTRSDGEILFLAFFRELLKILKAAWKYMYYFTNYNTVSIQWNTPSNYLLC